MKNKWAELVDRVCVTCSNKFMVQYQQTKKENGGKYCSRKCNPNFNAHLKKYIINPLGSGSLIAQVACKGCKKSFNTQIKNINRGGGSYCSRACNPAYAKKYDKATKARRSNLKTKYGLTVDDYDAMLKSQGGVCAICSEPPRDLSESRHARLHVDHSHVTGKVRQLLCASCNRALGWFRDNKNYLHKAIDYIERHES